MLSVSPSAKRLSKLGKWGKRSLQLLEVLIAGGNALLFIAKTYSCWEITFTADSNSSEAQLRVEVVTMTRTPTLQTRRN
jgi:hypothetical protein